VQDALSAEKTIIGLEIALIIEREEGQGPGQLLGPGLQGSQEDRDPNQNQSQGQDLQGGLLDTQDRQRRNHQDLERNQDLPHQEMEKIEEAKGTEKTEGRTEKGRVLLPKSQNQNLPRSLVLDLPLLQNLDLHHEVPVQRKQRVDLLLKNLILETFQVHSQGKEFERLAKTTIQFCCGRKRAQGVFGFSPSGKHMWA